MRSSVYRGPGGLDSRKKRIYQFFVFAVDYSRTEYTQFEDDDYYYYVKAVPKIAVSAPDVKVRRINARKAVRKERNIQNRK